MQAQAIDTDYDRLQQLRADLISAANLPAPTTTTTAGMDWPTERAVVEQRVRTVVTAFLKEHRGSPQRFQLCYRPPTRRGTDPSLERGGDFNIFPVEEYPDGYESAGCPIRGEWGDDDLYNAVHRSVWKLSLLPLEITA